MATKEVSISQARFLKWPLILSALRPGVLKCFNLSGEIPQVAACPGSG